ncbi:PQQ-binding-like beta-propeller repeat protein [Promicromonospora panici]|uniref:outer membrane protein assembly factor BamB family protein n=1 Tax=Promicromonospora panici TaxID=2219658 RepID=UPI00101D0F3F|nr:PQQ-binding-like beta-propeller repeat protein [Promicromonospora panici]
MARDPGEGEAFVFDLVDDDGDVPTSPLGPDAGAEGDVDGVGPDGAGLEAGGPLPHGALGLRLRALAPVAAVLAVVLGTGFAVDSMRDAARTERIREVPGGVVDVSAPLEEAWAWEAPMDAADAMGWFGVADLEGMLAFRSEQELIGLDPASGERAWSVRLREDSECGPLGYPGGTGLATSVLVCVQDAGAAREAFTVGPDGVASEPRALDTADDRRYGRARPGPDGMVLRAKRIGLESAIDVGDARCTETTGECSGTVEAGRDLQLRAEDATTGEERWSVTIPFRATAAQQCNPWFGEPWNGWEDVPADEALAPDVFGAYFGTGLIDLWGCGTAAAVTTGGALVRVHEEAGPATVLSLGTARHAGQATTMAVIESGGPPRTILFGPDGDVVREIPGSASVPQTTDEGEALTLLVSDESGYGLRSYAATDGAERWNVDSAGSSSGFLAQVAGIAVTATWTGSVRGFDLATGAEQWSWDIGEVEGSSSYGSEYAVQAFTDGRFVLLVLQGGDGTMGLASLDATSGELVWDGRPAGDENLPPGAMLLAVGGRLVAMTSEGISGLG